MTEESTVPEPTIVPGMTKAEVKEALAEHRREMDEHFTKQRNDLLEEIRGLGASDATEKAELKENLKKLTEWQDAQIKAQEERDKVTGDKHTIVTPPATLAPPVAPTTPEGQPPTSGESPKRKGFLGLW
jgi:hypothetical protein